MSQRSRVRYPVQPHTIVSPSADSRRAVVSYWPKYVHEALVNRLGGLSLPRKTATRLTDRPDMTIDDYRGRLTITQQQQPASVVVLYRDPVFHPFVRPIKALSYSTHYAGASVFYGHISFLA